MLDKLIAQKKAIIGVIGLGYVGLPLAVEIAKKGFRIVGFDIDGKRVREINAGISKISDVATRKLKPLVRKKIIKATGDTRQLKLCDIILICVPTPIDENKEPDLGPVIESTKAVQKVLRKGQLVILKSTTYPETTEKVILPILCKTGLRVGKDFYLAFCPERIDP